MRTRNWAAGIVFCGAIFALAACSSDSGSNQAPTGLQASRNLASDSAVPGGWLYRNPQANFAKYRRIMVENVIIYSGPEARFEEIEPADRTRYAQLVGATFHEVLAKKYQFAGTPAADVLRIRVTLIGVDTTVGGVATLTRVLPVGLAVNAVRGAAGSGGTMTGGIDLAVEIFDSTSNELLAGAVRKIEPATFDFEATLSTTDTVKVCAEEAATKLREALDRNLVAG